MLAVVGLGIACAACGNYQPFQPPPADSIPAGPGVFTGEAGEFVIFRAGTEDDGRDSPDNEAAPGSDPIPDLTRPPTP